MKTKLIILLLMSVILQACYKEQVLKPVKNNLTGVWLCDTPGRLMQLDIDNTMGIGAHVTYKEVKTDAGHFLVIAVDGVETTYQIVYLTATELVIQNDQYGVFYLKKVKDW